MNDPALQRLIAAQGMAPANMHRVATDQERQAAAHQLAMNVRTNAANMATQLLCRRQTSPATWSKWAEHIATYIWQGVDHGDSAPPV
jgi:hypothetical protein